MYDVFISHAHEDAEEIARPLAKALERYGLSVWIDYNAITCGESIREQIDKGLSESRYAVLVLGPAFFEKRWAKNELNALLQLDAQKKIKLLPVLHNLSHADVVSHSPLLSDRLMLSSKNGIAVCARRILAIIRPMNMDIKAADESDTAGVPHISADMSLLEIADSLGTSGEQHLTAIAKHVKKFLAVSENDPEMAMYKASKIQDEILSDVVRLADQSFDGVTGDVLAAAIQRRLVGGIVAKHCAYIATFSRQVIEGNTLSDSDNAPQSRRELELCNQSLKILINWYVNTYGLSPVRPAHLTVIGHGQFSPDDIVEVYSIEAEYFPKEMISPPDVVQAWYDHNPETLVGVRDLITGKVGGFINALPVTDELYSKLISGDYVDTHIPTGDVRGYDMPDFYKLYLSSICVAKKFVHTDAFKLLLQALIDKLLSLATVREIYITEVVADAITLKGEQLCRFAGLRPIKQSAHGSVIYQGVLLPPSLRIVHRSGARLVQFYERIYEEYKELL